MLRLHHTNVGPRRGRCSCYAAAGRHDLDAAGSVPQPRALVARRRAEAQGEQRPDGRLVDLSRRHAMLSSLLCATPAVLWPNSPALAIRDGPPVQVDPVPPFSLQDFTSEAGWTELDSGLLYKVVQVGEGDRAKGIFDKVDHFQPFPFCTVRYTAYEPSGRAFASSVATRRDYSYQAGVRQELQDETGAVMSMVVGERRQFVVPLELAYKRKLFGNVVPQRDALLVDVELLGLQPY